MTKTTLFIDTLPAYTGDIYHDGLHHVDFVHVVDADGLDGMTGQTAGIKLFDKDGKPKSVLIYPNGRKSYPYPKLRGWRWCMGSYPAPFMPSWD